VAAERGNDEVSKRDAQTREVRSEKMAHEKVGREEHW